MTVMKKNVNEIADMADLAKKIGNHLPALSLSAGEGGAKENEAVLTIENEDLIKATRKILEIPNTKNIGVTLERNVRAKREKMQKIDFCEAGCSMVSVAADGRVYPCNGLHENEFYVGDSRKQSLKDIWEKSDVLKRFKFFSIVDIPECAACAFKFFCGGGCHVNRHFVYKRLDVPTPFCQAHKELYWDLLFERMKEVQPTL